MPAFVVDGPNIPERLLQEHEEGRVVFFCGAGISTSAGLPDFRNLVKRLFSELGVLPNAVQSTAIRSKQYDTAVGLLEADTVGGRERVRGAIAEILTPNLTTPKATATHDALLTLARNNEGQMRLITTNFDRLFEKVIVSKDLNIECFTAPLLPVPKNRWDGLVYLHGLVPARLTVGGLDRLVVSSGDFGIAYLTERWAARFVSELFRNYTVCFVGYSINDPVLRYMMDAIAADRLLGETSPEMYAFGSYSKGKEAQVADEWNAKNVTPILYREHKKHFYMHVTLRVWAETYRDGVRGKEMIVTQHAITPPLASSRSDFAVGRVLWALTDNLAAKHFAGMNPVPPLKWLEPLAELQYGLGDLVQFGIISNASVDSQLRFSAIFRPTPYTHSTQMCIAGTGSGGSKLDGVMWHLARWLTRHLNDPKLILWLAKQGGQLHEQFVWLVCNRIEELDKMESDGKHIELEEIRMYAPAAIPGPSMRTLWRLVLSGRLKSPAQNYNLYDWFSRLKNEGLTPILRMELRDALSPRVTIYEPFRFTQESEGSFDRESIKDLVDWKIVLSSEHVHSMLLEQRDRHDWKIALPDMLQDFTILIRDVLDLKKELGGADDKHDMSYSDQPSISEHSQNNDFKDWTVLIDLVRDAWLAMARINPTQARLVAQSWWQMPYPLFKRLTFFAVANTDLFTTRESLNWLLADGCWWLWSVETQREMFRLLVELTPKLSADELAELEQAIIEGPLRGMFNDDIEPEKWRRMVDHEVWLALAKMNSTSVELGEASMIMLSSLNRQYPNWQLALDESDEFPVWMGSGGEWRKSVTAPRRRRDLMAWLKESDGGNWCEDDWRQLCREKFPTAAVALCGLAQNDVWPAKRWREALQVWAEDELLKRSWRYMAVLLLSMPDAVVDKLAHSLSWWLKAQAKVFEGQEELFFPLANRLLDLKYQEDSDIDDDPVSRAINHPVGHVTQALLDWWYRLEPKDTEGLSDRVKPVFTKICITPIGKFRHGRVLLAAHVVSLFRVDEGWTRTYLFPLFDWERSEANARVAWEGFLWSPSLYLPLLVGIKQNFLDTVNHYDQLGKHAEQYAAFLTYAGLGLSDMFTTKEFAETTDKLPIRGLQSAAQTLTRSLEGAGEQHGEYWNNRVLPYLKLVWPKSLSIRTPAISAHFSQLCVVAEETFPEAVSALRHWLLPMAHPNHIVNLLNEAKLCEQYPVDALSFLDAIIGANVQWLPRKIKQCLDDIGKADEELVNDLRFVRLAKLCREHEID